MYTLTTGQCQKPLAERIQLINNQIDLSRQIMVEILRDNRVLAREDITDMEAAHQWDAERENVLKLMGYLHSIESIVDSAEKYLFANCG